MRPNNGKPEVVIGCNIPNTKCSLYNNATGYSVAINQTTQQQTLTIDSFNSVLDVGNWSCTDGMVGAGQTTCTKKVKGKYTYFSSASCTEFVRFALLYFSSQKINVLSFN